jgi:hypothetical protein
MLLGLWHSLAFAKDEAAPSNGGFAFPAAGSVALNFTVIGSDLGALVYPDPATSKFDTVAGSGLGVSWYLNERLRLRSVANLQFSSFGYSNGDSFALTALGLALDLDFALLRSDRVLIYAGPFTEFGYVTGSYAINSTGATTSVSGFNASAGGVLGAEYFANRNFSVGVYCPATVRFVWTTTSLRVQSNPSELNVVGLQGFYVVLSYYL